MKRINIVSKIVLVFQLLIALKYATLFSLDVFDFLHEIFKDSFTIQWGLYVAIPFALLSVAFEAAHKKLYGTDEKRTRYRLLCTAHILLGLWNFFISGILINI